MAGPKKKKTAKGPARPIATTSIASKPQARVEATVDGAATPGGADANPSSKSDAAASAAAVADSGSPEKGLVNAAAAAAAAAATAAAGSNSKAVDGNPAIKLPSAQQLSPEEFERQLEESELQLLVEKYAPKVRRDAQRQRQRLETDRRLLRAQATSINISRWLPPDLVDQILDLIQAEHRFAATSSVASEGSAAGTRAATLTSEGDATARLWTLEETLLSVGFAEARVRPALKYVLDLGPGTAVPNKDSIWGLDEALSWLARECTSDELPDYDGRIRNGLKISPTPIDSPLPSRPHTPTVRLDPDSARNGRSIRGRPVTTPKTPSPNKKLIVTCDSDIEPDELVPQWVQAKEKVVKLERFDPESQTAPTVAPAQDAAGARDLEMARLEAKLSKIEADVLFDKFVAEQAWRARRLVLEKELAQARRQRGREAKNEKQPSSELAPPAGKTQDDVGAEADRIAAEIIAAGGASEDEDQGLTDLFEALPVSEVDPATGKTQTVINSPSGAKTVIRDFGKWTGIGPTRVLEEACRSRDSSSRIQYSVVSEASWACRHRVVIYWTKPQELPPVESVPAAAAAGDVDVNIYTHPTQFVFTMVAVSTPDSRQSEAFIATFALFHIFGSSQKEEKVCLRLPSVWRDFWSELADTRKSQLDGRDRDRARELRALIRQRKDQEDEDGVILPGAFRGRAAARGVADSGGDDTSQERASRVSLSPEYYKKIWADKSGTRKFQTMLQSRMQLPMWSFRQQILDTIDHHQVVIICGETGCGKSTQTPSFLLEHELSRGRACKIYCTEPRRISALSLARRVSEELGEGRTDVGTSRSLVGYSIRLESNTSKETRLVYATTGIVMRMLEGSSDLNEITHLILDEVHERSIDGDFLLIVLKRLMVRRRDLRVVLMSATVDAERFSKYLGGAPVLTVPGRTFPVQVRYLEDAIELTGYQAGDAVPDKMVDLDDYGLEEDSAPAPQTGDARADAAAAAIRNLSQYSAQTRSSLAQMDEYRIDYDLIVQLVMRIATDERLATYSGAILVFLPGIAEIRSLNDQFLGHPFFTSSAPGGGGGGGGWVIHPLHSSIATEDQEAAFLIPAPGFRKIVLATNIAETGITIPDVTCVIDTGKHKEMRFDERRQLSRLLDSFISRANAKQRRGRAGRVRDGLCFHLFTRHRHDHLMNDQQTPEMLRLSLQDLAIRVKVCQIGGIEETLADGLDPPSAKNIRRAIDSLIDVRALTSGEDLTALGRQLARLPLDVFLGKLVLQAVAFRCLDMALTVAALLSTKSPFSAPFGQRAQANKARLAFRRADSDLLTVYNAYLAWKRVCQQSAGPGKEFQFCRRNFLSAQTLASMEDIKGQLLVALVDSGCLSLTVEERQALSRLRFGARGRFRHQQQVFFDVPQRVDANSDNDAVTSAVISASFYPKLLVRDPPGSRSLRNIGNNQMISLHPTSVNRGRQDIEWLSYYHIMQAKQVYHAHETTGVDPFAIAVLCGDVRCELFAGVVVLDGNRGRFSVPDWKTMLVVKVLRTRLREMLARSFKHPGKLPTPQHGRWLDIWQRIFTAEAAKDGAGGGGVITVVTKG